MSTIIKNGKKISGIDKKNFAITDLHKFLENWDKDYQKKYQL